MEQCLDCEYCKTEMVGKEIKSFFTPFLNFHCTLLDIDVVGYDRQNDSKCMKFKKRGGKE